MYVMNLVAEAVVLLSVNLLPNSWHSIFMTSVSLLPNPTKCYDGDNFNTVGPTYREVNPEKSSLTTFSEETFDRISSRARSRRVSISSYAGVMNNLGIADVHDCENSPLSQGSILPWVNRDGACPASYSLARIAHARRYLEMPGVQIVSSLCTNRRTRITSY